MPQSLPRRSSDRLAAVPTEPVYGELPDRIHAQLREQIIRGRLAPEARLVEAELALRFAVSRTPIREVLARLVRESFVVTDGSGRRTRFLVAPLTGSAIPELWGIMGALEGLAIQAAARMARAERTSLVVELEELNAALGQAATARPRDIDQVGDLMSAFHICFMNRSSGSWLRVLYDATRPHVQRYEWAYGAHVESNYAPSVAEHRGIIAAVSAGDARAAKDRIERHWANGARRTVDLIERVRPKRS